MNNILITIGFIIAVSVPPVTDTYLDMKAAREAAELEKAKIQEYAKQDPDRLVWKLIEYKWEGQ